MTKVKICGITTVEEIQFINQVHQENEINYIGFVFFEKSKRNVCPQQAKQLKQKLNSDIKTVGVFVDQAVSKCIETAKQAQIDCIQLHGNETISYIEEIRKNFGGQIWKAIRSNNVDNDVKKYSPFVDILLIDTCCEKGFGGLGKSFDLEVLNNIKNDIDFMKTKIIIAGGLQHNNVGEVINFTTPYAIDVSSGVEIDGKKDFGKIFEFVQKTKAQEA